MQNLLTEYKFSKIYKKHETNYLRFSAIQRIGSSFHWCFAVLEKLVIIQG